MLSVQIDDAGL